MDFILSGAGGRDFRIHVREVPGHDPSLIRTLLEIDQVTFSELTYSRWTASFMMRYGRTFLLMADEVVIGSCHCARSWADPAEAVLFSMAIRPGWRGRGLGTRFMQAVGERLKAHAIKSVVLDVDTANKAGIRIYQEKFGFELVERSEQEYGVGYPRVILRRHL